MDKVITISRQYGSGGREVGSKLAEQLGIPFYDNEIIARAAKESGFAEAAFARAEEKATNSLLYSIAMGMNAYGNQDFGYSSLSLDDKIFLAQSNIIRKVAEEGPCIIVGRCADYILKDKTNVMHIFVYAGLDFRIERATMLYGISKEKAGEEVLKYDKRRSNYYNYHTSDKWATLFNYDISVRTDFAGIDHAVETIKKFITV
ncbi:MAG: AAA family ATPase [Velocimicrobium sp.]